MPPAFRPNRARQCPVNKNKPGTVVPGSEVLVLSEVN